MLIWTTTPWTIPGNRAVAFGDEVEYALVEVTDPGDGEMGQGRRDARHRDQADRARGESGADRGDARGREIPGRGAGRHDLPPSAGRADRPRGYDHATPLYAGDFVTDEDGTGFVHIAPGHGEDDFDLGQKHNLPVPQTVGEDGLFYDHVPLFAGTSVYTAQGKEGTANEAVIAKLLEAKALLARGKLVHSYPHSWRSKAPLIFRNTAQWFISMESQRLAQKPRWPRSTRRASCRPRDKTACAA